MSIYKNIVFIFSLVRKYFFSNYKKYHFYSSQNICFPSYEDTILLFSLVRRAFLSIYKNIALISFLVKTVSFVKLQNHNIISLSIPKCLLPKFKNIIWFFSIFRTTFLIIYENIFLFFFLIRPAFLSGYGNIFLIFTLVGTNFFPNY